MVSHIFFAGLLGHQTGPTSTASTLRCREPQILRRAEALLRMTIHRCTDGTTEVVPDIELPWPREVDSNFSQMKKAARKPPFPELEARTTATARSLPASPWAL